MPSTTEPSSSSVAEHQFVTPGVEVNFVPVHKPGKQSNANRKHTTSNAAKEKSPSLQKASSSNSFSILTKKIDDQNKENLPFKRVRKPTQKVAEALRAEVEALSKTKG